MNKKELILLVEQEISWLQYYGWRKSREELTIDSNIYEDLQSIGYTKKVIPLYNRCAAAFLTFEELDLEKVYVISENRNVSKNIFTALEVYLMLFPDQKENIIEKIKDY